VSNEDNVPVQHSVITLFIKDSAILNGLTGKDGFFALNPVKPGFYHLDIANIGFEK
jgi:hypothetical protein